MIRLTSDRHLGPLLRKLRRDAGLSLNAVSARCNVTKGGLSKREIDARAMTAGALIETLDALGYDLLAVPRDQHFGRAA